MSTGWSATPTELRSPGRTRAATPNIAVDSIIANPNFPIQVFAGSDFGLYYTDDITANPPVWNRFNNGIPNVMIWDMAIDRGATTLSLWTRSRGAYVWPLPLGPRESSPDLGTAGKLRRSFRAGNRQRKTLLP